MRRVDDAIAPAMTGVPRPVRSRRRALVLLAMTAMMLSACSGGSGPRPKALSTPSPAIAPSKSPSPTSDARSASQTAAPPSVGTTLATIPNLDGRVSVISNGQGFTVVNSVQDGNSGNLSTLIAYDAAGKRLAQLAPGSYTGECGADDVVVPGVGRTLIGQITDTQPAQGINQATTTQDLRAWDATTGEVRWTSRIMPPTVLASDAYASCSAFDGHLKTFSATSNGRWGLATRIDGEAQYVLDLATGKSRRDNGATSIVGNYVAHSVNDHNNLQPTTLFDPQTGVVVGHNPPGLEVALDSSQVYELAASPPKWVFSYQGGNTDRGLTSDSAHFVLSGKPGPAAMYTLPGMSRSWQTSSEDFTVLGDGGGVSIYGATDGVVGLDDKTGSRLWAVPAGDVCAVTDSQMLLHVGNQLAVIDMHTGKQVSFSDGDNCPTMVPGGVEVQNANRVLTLTQLLAQ